MGKISLLLLAIALTIFGISVTAGHPAWGGLTGVAILLLAVGLAGRALAFRSQSEGHIVERSVAGQKISNSLIALSSGAILAVYAAGYHRTGSAADKFSAQTARRGVVRSLVRYKNGIYVGWGSCRHGDIEAAVVIQGGKIVSAVIAQCLTRYSCSWIAALPGQVLRRQNPDVDYVTGATESSDAFHDAIAKALSHASE